MKLSKLFRRQSVAFYIFLILFILILPLNILFIDSAKRSSNALLSQTEYNISSVAAIYIRDIESRIERTNAFLSNIMENNANCQTVFHQTGDDQYQLGKFLLAQDLIASSVQQNEGDLYFIYSPRLSDFLLLKRSELARTVTHQANEEITAHIMDAYASDWRLVEIEGLPYLMHANFSHNMYLGALIGLSTTECRLENSLDYESVSSAFLAGEPEPADDALLNVALSPAYSSMTLSLSIDKQEALRDLSFFQRYSFSIALFYLLLLPLLFLLFGILLLRPMKTILHALTQLKDGNQDFRISNSNFAEYKRHRQRTFFAKEFSEINDSFNHMADSIHKLTIENYEQELARAQVELDNLQLTIRPHFLQNTFGILFTLCQMGENEQLGHFILYLSDYFRYIYQGIHQLASFDSEYAIIRGYIEIARVQHPHGFMIAYEIPKYTSDIFVPPLLIHNFVENIMSHALKHGSCLHILIRVEKDDTDAIFTISDDGIGIPPKALAAINQGKNVSNGKRIHVGLHNSWQRLDKIYHGTASMRAESTEGKGTTITIRLPLQTKEN